MATEYSQILIAGGGATGLMLGCLLAVRNIPFLILEKNQAVSTHSRSIGIHPPSIPVFKEIGLEKKLLEQANKVTKGIASVERKKIGEIHFSHLKTKYPFILTLSQAVTEQMLEDRLHTLAPGCLIRGTAVKTAGKKHEHICINTDSGKTYTCKYLIGSDGKNSTIRQLAGISFGGIDYPDTYIMGDFSDTVGARNEAHVYLCRDGLVESFPHGGNLRRWVIKTKRFISNPDTEYLVKEAKKRTGIEPDLSTNSMISSFGVQKRIASTFLNGNMLLAGDAAHVVSPIGGQGMNLGWLDAAHLARVLEKPDAAALLNYAIIRRRKAMSAAKRAEFNMKTGRAYSSLLFKEIMVRFLLLPPIKTQLLKQFTMHGLDS